MSAFAVIYDRSGQPVEPGLLERALERLGHRGPDGCDVLGHGHVLMGHQHFWTTPEETGERQPLRLKDLPFTIVLDGRLDNRPELLAELRIPLAEGNLLSDAALVLHAYARWTERCFEHFIGAYALAIWDQREGEVVCARDALGDRTLFYSVHGTRIIITSEPWAAASGLDIVEVDDVMLVHSYAVREAPGGLTFFKNVQELLPGHVITFHPNGQRMIRSWQPDFSIKLRRKQDEEYAEEFRSLLEQSIRSRLRSNTPVGILMSGGLDSTSVACLAARSIAPQKLTTISYVFDELHECDERKYIEDVKDQYGIQSIQIPCDDAWTFKDWQAWPHNPNQPEGNPFRLLKERAYQRAQVEGMRILLTGGCGDHLYSAGVYWLPDLLWEGKLSRAGKELTYLVRRGGLPWLRRTGFIQNAVRRLFKFYRKDPRSGLAPLAWVTDFTSSILSKVEIPSESIPPGYENMLGLNAAASTSGEIFHASRHKLELRHPYRDLRLVEFVLKLPAYQLLAHGMYKHILRNAMRGILPESIRMRQNPTSLEALFHRGVEREATVLETCFTDPQAAWRKFVRADWLVNNWKVLLAPDRAGAEVLVPWVCVSNETWYKSSLISDE
jgi:asparagine synthase (glutamine-hydrolysing)